MKILVPMAGRGQRFAELSGMVKDYSVPKPMIKVLGKPLVRWAIESYSYFLSLDYASDSKPVKMSDLVFVCLQEHEDNFKISSYLQEVFNQGINIIFTKQVTRGPAETTLLAKEFIDPNEDIIISDCDHHFDALPLWRVIGDNYRGSEYVGILPIIKPTTTEPSWSYVVLNPKAEVIEIREKDPDLANAMAYGVIGAYYFRRWDDFVEEASKMIEDNDKVGDSVKPEFYVSRVYQRIIQRQGKIKSAFISKGHILGTPKQLQEFLQGQKV